MESLPHEGRKARIGIARAVWLALGSIGLLGGSLIAAVTPASAQGGATNQYNLNQCANGGKGTLAACAGSNYQNGNLNENNSHWAEGEFVPFQLILTNITSGSHTLTIQYQEINGGDHAYDYLGSFNATETTGAPTPAFANQNNPCVSDIVNCNPASPVSTKDIPSPDFSNVNSTCGVTTGNSSPGTLPSGRKFSLWGPAGSSLTSAVYQSPQDELQGSNNCLTLIDVTFTAPSDGSTLVLAWSGHIASQADWGGAIAAGNISGSPYHMWINQMVNSPTDTTKGAQERDMKVTASTPTISTVIKNAAGTAITRTSTVTSGTLIHDTATLTGATSSAGGTVTYELFNNLTCDGTPMTIYPAETVTNGAVPDSPSFNAAVGNYSYLALYSGDPTNAPAKGACEGPFTVTAVQAPVIDVIKSEPTPGDGTSVTAGQTAPITYNLAVSNFGSLDASNVVVTDVVPTGTTYVSGSAGPAADAPSYDSTTNTVTWTVPTVTAETGSTPGVETLTFQVTVNSSDAAGSTIVNQAAFTNVNTPSCNVGSVGSVDTNRRSVALTCLTNQVSNPVIVITPGTSPLVTTTTTTVKPKATTTTTKAALAFTGSRAGLLGAVGAGLVGSGGLVLLLNRRRGRSGRHFPQK